MRKKTSLAIVSAMPVEQAAIIKAITNTEIKILDQTTMINNFKNIECISTNTGIGQVNCAIRTMALIHNYNPDFLIFSGIAGSLQPEINIGDVVISHDILSIELLSINNIFSPNQKKNNHFKRPDVIHCSANNLLYNYTNTKTKNFNWHFAKIASSDFFPAPNYFFEIPNFHEFGAIDMESAAFAQVCNYFNKPFVVIRSISNFVNPNHGEVDIHASNMLLACENSALMTLDILESYS